MKGRRLELAIAVILAAVWGAVLAALHWDGGLRTLERIEATATDLRMAFRGTRTPPDRVTVVAIDDETVRVDGSYPVSRATLAQIIDAVAALGPSAVAVDLLLVDPGNAAEDARLARALGRVPSVIAAAAVYAGGTQTIAATGNAALDRIPRAERFLLPLPQFAAAAAVGVVNVGTDDAGRPRFFPMLFRTEDRIEASLPLRAAALGVGAVPDVGPDGVTIDGRIVRTDLGHILPINFYGPRGTIRTVSAASLLRGDVASADIEGRVVVIGATVTGGGDVFPTPFDPVLPGVEVIATAVTQLMAGDGLIRTPGTRRVDAAVAVVLPALLVALLWWRRSVMGIFAMLGVMLAWLAANAAAFAQGIWFGAALPLAAALPPLVVFALAQIWLARRSSQHFAAQSRALQRFHAPALAELLVRDPGFLARPVEQQAAVIFIDLSGFTGLSEAMGAAAVRELLNGYYARIEEPVASRGGAITNFMGDGAMIVFGLPEPRPGMASKCIDCCAGLAEATRSWIETLPRATASLIGFKIGAHLGAVVLSRLGGGSQQQITATGDTVNTASRLMEVAAGQGFEVAVSDDLMRAAGSETVMQRSGTLSGPREASIRGRTGAMQVWLWRSEPPQP
ncbi:MAG: CHASE2 domain-containing protein [Aestuariivirga sp.]